MLFYILTYRFYYLLRQCRRAPALLAEVEQLYEIEKRSKRFHTTMSISNEEIDYQNCIWVKVRLFQMQPRIYCCVICSKS